MTLKEQALSLPMTPGCYIMKDKKQEILYIGKAKKLKRRVSSYFNKQDREKMKRLMHRTASFEVIHTESEEAALVLEAALIMHYQPYYNRALKEERRLFSMGITKKKNPQLILFEQPKQPLLYSFGPFPSRGLAELLYVYLERKYPLSKCQKNVGHPCMYVELGLCLGGCHREISLEEYQAAMKPVVAFLSLSYQEMLEQLLKERSAFVEDLAFERAEQLQPLINWLGRYAQRPLLSVEGFPDFDYVTERQTAYFSVFYVQHIRNRNRIYDDWWVAEKLDSEEKKILSIAEYYSKPNRLLPQQLFLQKSWVKAAAVHFPKVQLRSTKHQHQLARLAEEKMQVIYQVQKLFHSYTKKNPRFINQKK